MLPLSLLNTAKGHPMLVELKNGDTYNGRLVACNIFMNIMLKDVICTSKDGDRFFKMSECYIHGNNIKYLRLPEEIVDLVPDTSQRDRSVEGRGGRGRGGRFNMNGRGDNNAGRGRGEFTGRGDGRGRGNAGRGGRGDGRGRGRGEFTGRGDGRGRGAGRTAGRGRGGRE